MIATVNKEFQPARSFLNKFAQVNTCTYICKQILALMDTRRDIFQAIADPTRRAIIHLISHKPENLTSISDNFAMSRQAVTLHIKILEECGLIVLKQHGRERYCELKPGKLKEVDEWISHYRIFWTKKFTSLHNFIDNENRAKSKTKKIGK